MHFSLFQWCQNLNTTVNVVGAAVATVCVGCAEAPEPVFVCCHCVWGSWHLQTAHTSDHCGLWRCTAVQTTELTMYQHSLPWRIRVRDHGVEP